MKTMLSLTLCFGSLGLACFDLPAFDFDTTILGDSIRWSSENPRMRASEVSFPSGSGFRDALGQAINLWNQTPSQFRFDITYGEDYVSLYNLQNEIWASDSDYWLDGAPAVTYTAHFGRGLTEADILFDADESFVTCQHRSHSLGYGGTRPFQTIALHELGHALGLLHEAGTYNIMGQDWDHIHANGNTVHFYAGEDAMNGTVALYGLDSSLRQDVGVVHWRHTGHSGEYSTHGRTRIFNLAGSENSRVAGTGDDPVYRVTRGHTILLEMTFENNGASTQTPRVGYYLSTDRNITTSDTLLATRTPTVGRNTVYTTTQQLVIPSSLTRGTTYYLGAIIDDQNTIAEINEDNNATYAGIRID